ncbi:MAG: class I SAM-dependent methyltransferase [Acetatifactor sp.]|nr:class I SAM-dependent methyltransferase [Acetatifactor sp.]
MVLFPYQFCKKGSRVLIYGAGKFGLDFYMQLHLNNYCDVVAWVDKEFGETVERPLDKVENISKYDFDYLVIAIGAYDIAMSVKQKMKDEFAIPEEKIVWSAQYAVTGDFFPIDKDIRYNDFNRYLDLFDEYMKSGIEYGGERYYQSCEQLHLTGSRNSGKRILEYEVTRFINATSNVLDIGCNTGFLDLELAGFAKTVTGIDVISGVVNVARKAAEYLNINNAYFYCKNILKSELDNKYDVILLLAVHGIFQNDSDVLHLSEALNKNGYLFFESHQFPGDEEKYIRRLFAFLNNGFKLCLSKTICDDGVSRLFCVLQKE